MLRGGLIFGTSLDCVFTIWLKTIVELDIIDGDVFQVSYDIKTEDPVKSKIQTDAASKASKRDQERNKHIVDIQHTKHNN